MSLCTTQGHVCQPGLMSGHLHHDRPHDTHCSYQCILRQMNEDGTPSNRLDSLARSIVQDLGSMQCQHYSWTEKAVEDPLIQQGMTKANGLATISIKDN